MWASPSPSVRAIAVLWSTAMWEVQHRLRPAHPRDRQPSRLLDPRLMPSRPEAQPPPRGLLHEEELIR